MNLSVPVFVLEAGYNLAVIGRREQILMNRAKVQVGAALLSLSMITAAAVESANKPANRWGLDQTHCKAMFTVSHEGLAPVTGWFNKVRGSLDYDGKNLAKAKITAHIETASLNSGSDLRDFHLKSEHFFDVKQFPDISFESTEVKPLAPGKFKMTGNLEIRGIKKKVTLDCQGPTGPIVDDHKQTRIGVTAKTKLNKKDFGMVWNREVAKGVFLVADDAEINLEIECIKI